MSDIKLFRIDGIVSREVPAKPVGLEKSLQTVIEHNLVAMLGVRFLRSEHKTGQVHRGRIDTLGIDEDGCPVIIEYKRAVNENVINQGLFYLDWLLDHKAEFELMVLKTFGDVEAARIDWSAPRLVCIAADFTRYDINAVKQINRNIDLMRYRHFAESLLSLELVHTNTAETIIPEEVEAEKKTGKRSSDKTFAEWLVELKGSPLLDLYETLRAYILALGDDVQEKELKLYTSFRKIKNFSCVVLSKKSVTLYLRLNPESVPQMEPFMRDVRKIGHWATGDLEVSLTSPEQMRTVEPLILRAYEES